MNWSDLPYFLSVARTGQLNRAAAALGTDATTVGRRIRRLERDLGERLFEQGAGGQELTQAGIDLMQRAEAMSAIAQGIGQSGAALRGPVRLSVAEGFGTWFISRHLAEFSALHPQLEVDLVANSGFLNPTRRETDLAVVLAQPRRGPLMTRRLTNYRLRLYASRAYLERSAAIADPADLPQHTLIGYVPDIIYAPELRYIEELPGDARPKLRSSSINAQHALVASGAGIGVLPCFIGDADPSLARILPGFEIERSFWLVAHRETHGFAHVRAMRNWLVGLAQQHQGLLLGTKG
ncbi:LysR family transcriptional regulator [Sphingomonas soli]|uniref:LysR family transcriptional regulator n=1 Tax=Sphingomonas soli TaxID=266127 RepID=UPI00082EFD4E|nr:LysR family transcriptional regulator [Sphingomonas soli]